MGAGPARRWPLILALSCLLHVTTPAQEEEPLPIPFIEREEVRFVTLDVTFEERMRGIANGRWHRPRDLRREQVEVLVGGETMIIDLFENRCAPMPEPPLLADAGSPDSPLEEATSSEPSSAPIEEPAPLSPGSEEPARYVLYFDMEHLNLHGRHVAFSAALQWAEEMAGSRSEVMIITGGRGLRIVRPMSAISDEVLEDLQAARDDFRTTELWAAKEWLRLQEISEAPGSAKVALSNQYARIEHSKTRRSLNNLRDLMAIFDSMEGTKNLILFADTIRFVPGSVYPFVDIHLSDMDFELRRLAEAANERNVRFYPVQARFETYADPAFKGLEGWADSAFTMLATETGGRYLYGTNRADPIFDWVAEDAACFYRIGFRIRTERTGRTLPIKIRLHGRKGEDRLRYNRSLEDPTREQRDEAAVRAAFLVPSSARDFPIAVQAAEMSRHDDGARVRLQVIIPLHELLPLPVSSGEAGTLQVRLEVGAELLPLRSVDSEGGPSASRGLSVDFTTDREPWGFGRQAALTLPPSRGGRHTPNRVIQTEEVDVPRGSYRFVAVVQDRLANTIAAASTDLEVGEPLAALGEIGLAIADRSAIVLDTEHEWDDAESGRRSDEIVPVPPLLPEGVIVIEEHLVEAGRPAHVFYTLCGEDGVANRRHRSSGRPFEGWRLRRAIICSAEESAARLPERPPPAPAGEERCVPVVETIPGEVLLAGTCLFVVHLERPGLPEETRELRLRVLPAAGPSSRDS